MPLPEYPVLNSASLVQKLRAREASDVFFREVYCTAKAVYQTLTDNNLKPLAAALMPATNLETGTSSVCGGVGREWRLRSWGGDGI